MVQVARVQNANRMMISVESSKEGIKVTFADGLISAVPWTSIREVHSLTDVDSIQFDTPFELVIRTWHGEVAEIPWDFVRHAGDHEYRKDVDGLAQQSQRRFAERLREFRHRTGLSQRELAERSGVGRVTIARIESATQSPKLETVQRLATAMGYPIQALLMDDWKKQIAETRG